MKVQNPILYTDFPDPDVIRVGDTYYMASTTMYLMPGCDILRSYDLVHWELLCHAYETLDDTPGHNLEGLEQVYGQGMWAPSLNYHKGTYYITFTGNDTHRTYLFTAQNPAGPWTKKIVEGFYYDNGLFFDDDDKVYIVHGNRTLHITQLLPDVSGPMPGGLDRMIVQDREDAGLGYEGSHLYKHDGKYVLFTCHMPANEKKTEDVFVADSLEGEFVGKCLINDACGYRGLGVAQGGMVDTPEGDWYLFMFQDQGALGRAPFLMEMDWVDGYPHVKGGAVEREIMPVQSKSAAAHGEYVHAPLNGSDDFSGPVLKDFWQFNHNPIKDLWSLTEAPGAFRVKTGRLSPSFFYAQNMLTQRCVGPACAGEVTVDGSLMKDGDTAGLATLISCYGLIALRKEAGQYYLIMEGRQVPPENFWGDKNYEVPGVTYAKIPLDSSKVRLRIEADFHGDGVTSQIQDQAQFYYLKDGAWVPFGITQKMYFHLDLFTGCRFALAYFAQEEIGGVVDFRDFTFEDLA